MNRMAAHGDRETGDHDLPFSSDSMSHSEPWGVYVHIPFCLRKCPYCDFYSIEDLTLKRDFIEAIKNEIVIRGNPDIVVDTLYFGGGTPSLLDPEDIGEILEAIRVHFTLTKDIQVTMEVNPGTVSHERSLPKRPAVKTPKTPVLSYGKLADFRALGINRLSVGVQSFSDEKLRFLHRIHTVDDALKSIDAARRAGFDEIGIDLIYGLPNESLSSWQRELDRSLSLKLEHLSCYMLTYEPGTPLHASLQSGALIPLDESLVATLFQLTSRYLESNGFCHYEISNFAKIAVENDGFESRHNKKYWNMVPYMGFGPSAHSYDGRCRFWNHADVKRYVHCLNGNDRESFLMPFDGPSDTQAKQVSPLVCHERLTSEQKLMEVVMLGLRRRQGIDIEKVERLVGKQFDIFFAEAVRRITVRSWGGYAILMENGSRKKNNFFQLNIEGWRFLDTATSWFIDMI